MGVVLAGGAGLRMGAPKATAVLAGRPLISYPLEALRAAGVERAVVAKPDTALPPLGHGVELWLEPATPRHPLTGLIEALRRAGGRSVLALACDLPLVGAGQLAPLLAAGVDSAPAVVFRADGRLQPLCGLYRSGALPLLERAAGDAPLGETVVGLGATVLDVADPAAFLNVNTPADLARAAVLLSGP